MLTGVLLRIGIDHRTVSQYNLKVNDIVGCPAVLSAEETHSTCKKLSVTSKKRLI